MCTIDSYLRKRQILGNCLNNFNIDSISEIISSNIHLDTPIDGNGHTLLHVASKLQDVDIVNLLLQNGASIDIGNNESNYTALHYAIMYYSPNIVRLLMLHPDIDTSIYSRPDLQDTVPLTATGFTIVSKKYDLFMMTMRPNNLEDTAYNNSLLACATYTNQFEVVYQLINRYGADVNETNNEGVSPLMIACEQKYVFIARYLIDVGANINAKDNNGKSVLEYARTDFACLRMLVKNGVQTTTKDRNSIMYWSDRLD
jgi:ankyrin repeat protein